MPSSLRSLSVRERKTCRSTSWSSKLGRYLVNPSCPSKDLRSWAWSPAGDPCAAVWWAAAWLPAAGWTRGLQIPCRLAWTAPKKRETGGAYCILMEAGSNVGTPATIGEFAICSEQSESSTNDTALSSTPCWLAASSPSWLGPSPGSGELLGLPGSSLLSLLFWRLKPRAATSPPLDPELLFIVRAPVLENAFPSSSYSFDSVIYWDKDVYQ